MPTRAFFGVANESVTVKIHPVNTLTDVLSIIGEVNQPATPFVKELQEHLCHFLSSETLCHCVPLC
jgi:hypothetical protein